MSSNAAKKTTRSSASAPTTRRRRRGTTTITDGEGNNTSGGHPARSTRSSAKRKRGDDDEEAGSGSSGSPCSGYGDGSGGSGSSDGSSQRRQRKRQKRSSASSPTSNNTSTTAAAKKRKEEKPQDADDHDGELKAGTTIIFGGGGGDRKVNDENISGNAHNLALTAAVVRTLGSGAHGTVYLAEEAEKEDSGSSGSSSKTQYVLKVPMATKEDIKEAQVEIRALEALKGVSGVVQLVASSHIGSTVCMLLKHVDGQVLEEYIEQRGCLSLFEAWGLMKQLVATLVEMKKKAGLSHLDIKPDNCLVTTNSKDRRLILFDLGTARPCDRPTCDDLGSVFFDAPEICRGNKKKKAARTPYDPPSADMYSVARTFLVALVGYHPCRSNSTTNKAGGGDWWEEDTFGTIDEHIGSIRERCPAAADLLERLLRSDPTKRPTAEQALEALTDRPWE